MDVAFAVPGAEGQFYRYCYVSRDGVRERELLPGEWLDEQVVPGSVRCDRFEVVATAIRDARLHPEPASLSTAGFALRRHAAALVLPDLSAAAGRGPYEAWLRGELLPKAAKLVHSAVEEDFGRPVDAVHAIDFTLRTTDGSGVDPRNVVLEAHADFTPESGARRLREERVVFKLGDGRAITAEDRPLLVNLWQPLVETVYRVPLAVCDGRSLASEDLVRKTMYFESRTGEVFNVRRGGAQEWWYYRHMRAEEALLFVTWTPDGKTTAHSAVEDPTDPADAPPRRSLEVRFAVRFKRYQDLGTTS